MIPLLAFTLILNLGDALFWIGMGLLGFYSAMGLFLGVVWLWCALAAFCEWLEKLFSSKSK